MNRDRKIFKERKKERIKEKKRIFKKAQTNNEWIRIEKYLNKKERKKERKKKEEKEKN